MEKLRIAMVDDEPDIILTYGELLSEFYDVLPFNSGVEFINYLKTRPTQLPVAIISDFQMKHLNGVDMLRESRKYVPRLPSMLFSGRLDKDIVVEATKLGVLRFLEKPVSVEIILQELEVLILDHNLQQAREQAAIQFSELKKETQSGGDYRSSKKFVDSLQSLDTLFAAIKGFEESYEQIRLR